MNEFLLTDEQLFILHQIYSKRLRLLGATFTAFPIFLMFSLKKADFNEEYKNEVVNYTNAFIILILLLSFALIWFKKVRPIRRDIKLRSGIFESRIIIRKTAFEHVHKYFIFFDDPKLPSKEVLYEEFNQLNEGDAYQVPLSKHSRLILDGFMNFELF
jgi:hypothetical protein